MAFPQLAVFCFLSWLYFVSSVGGIMSHRNHGNHRNFLSTEHTENTEITGKRCWLKIIFKILVKISSISDAIPIKILPKSEVFERILVKDFR